MTNKKAILAIVKQLQRLKPFEVEKQNIVCKKEYKSYIRLVFSSEQFGEYSVDVFIEKGKLTHYSCFKDFTKIESLMKHFPNINKYSGKMNYNNIDSFGFVVDEILQHNFELERVNIFPSFAMGEFDNRITIIF